MSTQSFALSSYGRVLRRPGALVFSTGGFVARLPMAMVSLGIVLLVADRSGSYRQAGTVSALFLLANASCAVPQARLIDRWGQARVLGLAAVTCTASLAGLIATVETDMGRTGTWLAALLAGATLPQIGSSVRARWAHLVEDRSQLRTAFAFESVLDEVIFIIGPALVTVLATTVHPASGLGFAALATLGGTAVLIGHRSSQPAIVPVEHDQHRPAMPWARLAPLVGCAFTMGVLLGGSEVATVAYAAGRGTPGTSGLLLSIWAVGSLVSGIVVGTLTVKASSEAQFRRCIVALGVLAVPLPFVSGVVAIGACLFVSGCAISPTLISAFARIEELVPDSRITEGITVVTTGLGAGLAPGAGVTGWAVDSFGSSAGFWVPVVAGLSGAAVAMVLMRPGQPASEPTCATLATSTATPMPALDSSGKRPALGTVT